MTVTHTSHYQVTPDGNLNIHSEKINLIRVNQINTSGLFLFNVIFLILL